MNIKALLLQYGPVIIGTVVAVRLLRETGYIQLTGY